MYGCAGTSTCTCAFHLVFVFVEGGGGGRGGGHCLLLKIHPSSSILTRFYIVCITSITYHKVYTIHVVYPTPGLCVSLDMLCILLAGNSSAVSFQPALTCSEDYYFNGSVCLAQCGQWVQFPRPVARSVVGTELFAALFGCISEVALIAMFIHQRSRV